MSKKRNVINTVLNKTLVIILAAVLLSAGITVVLFSQLGINAFAKIKLEELEPRAQYLANLTAQHFQGFMGDRQYAQSVNTDREIWDASIYVYDSAGTLRYIPGSGIVENEVATISTYIDSVLLGEEASITISGGASGLLIGKPVASQYGNVLGAVFLIKPMAEITATINSLASSLLISTLIAFAVMIIPAYLGSRSIAQPLSQMNEVALTMAKGDFTARASEHGTVELAQLGTSLNFLSSELSSTINDLTFERNRMRAVINGMVEGVIAVDRSGQVIEYNPAAIRLMGGETDAKPDDLPLFIELWPTVFSVLQNSEMQSEEYSRRDYVLRATVTPLHDAVGGIEGALILLQDVTEATRLEQTRRDYVANVSHELRTPIASILGLADALNDGLVKKEDDKQRYYGYIQKESVRLGRLIDDLLELSRLQSGTIAIAKQRVHINDLVNDVAERYSSVAEENGLSFHVDLASEPMLGFSNPDRLEQVLIALLDNAIKHTAGAGEIQLSTVQNESNITLLVRNTGHIDEYDIEHIFDRFYKADKAHTGGGTGLGLSISKEIIDLLSERIWAKNEEDSVVFGFTVALYEAE